MQFDLIIRYDNGKIAISGPEQVLNNRVLYYGVLEAAKLAALQPKANGIVQAQAMPDLDKLIQQ